jgi:citrate lyase subunit beta-like protein
VSYKDNDHLKAECVDGRQLGFTGKVLAFLFRTSIVIYSLILQQAIHPSQIDIIQSTFVPTSEGECVKINIHTMRTRLY